MTKRLTILACIFIIAVFPAFSADLTLQLDLSGLESASFGFVSSKVENYDDAIGENEAIKPVSSFRLDEIPDNQDGTFRIESSTQYVFWKIINNKNCTGTLSWSDFINRSDKNKSIPLILSIGESYGNGSALAPVNAVEGNSATVFNTKNKGLLTVGSLGFAVSAEIDNTVTSGLYEATFTLKVTAGD